MSNFFTGHLGRAALAVLLVGSILVGIPLPVRRWRRR